MKTFKKVFKEEVVKDKTICNKCGVGPEVHRDECVEVKYTFGYFSDPKLFGDQTQVSFDLCERCVFELVKKFIVPASVFRYDFEGDL